MPAVINTSIQINANPKEVWNTLLAFDHYGWNPFMKSIEGKAAVGQTLTVTFEGMVIKPTVLVVDEYRELLWSGKLLVSGIFDGKHRFQLSENSDGTTTFNHSEQFSGLLIPFFKKRIATEFTENFEQMNHALKAKVEGATAA